MKNKTIYIYIFIIVFLLCIIFLMLFSSEINSKFIGASLSNISENDNIVIQAARNMIEDNIDDYDGENTITIGDLIKKGYISNEKLGSDIDKKTRIIFVINDEKITDIYLKNKLFSNIFSCLNTCYVNDKKYISINNEIYKIMKVDSGGKVYATKGNIKEITADKINFELKKEFNKFDKKTVNSVINVSYNDIKQSKILNVDRNLFIKINNEDKIYNYTSKKVENLNNESAGIIPVIVLNDTITYEMGDGTEFNPYIVSR